MLQEQQKLEALAAAKAEASCVDNENAEREDNNSNPVDNIIQKDKTNDNGKNENLPASANESSDDSPRQDNDIFPQKIAVNVQQTQFTNTNLPNMQQPFVSNINRNQPMFYSVGQDILTPLPGNLKHIIRLFPSVCPSIPRYAWPARMECIIYISYNSNPYSHFTQTLKSKIYFIVAIGPHVSLLVYILVKTSPYT